MHRRFIYRTHFPERPLKTLGVKCSGGSLGFDRQDCDAELRTIRRGASNVYFPKVESSASHRGTTHLKNVFRWIGQPGDLDKETRDNTIRVLASGTMMDAEELIEIVDRRLEYNQSSEDRDLKEK